MKIIIIILLTIGMSTQLSAQNFLPISIGYYTPYGVNPGLKIGTYFEWKEWGNTEDNNRKTLSINPKIGYWNAISYSNNVHRTMLIDGSLEYKSYTRNQRFYGLAAVTLGYHLSFERVANSVNIGMGQQTPTIETLHYFVPTLNLGFGQRINDKLEYYFKIDGGQRLNTSTDNDLFVAAELGLVIHFKKN